MDSPKPVLPTESTAGSQEQVVLALEKGASEQPLARPASRETLSDKS